jgi:serine/threonine protein phosphatase 1
MPGRTIAIGDIHGCSTALAALLDAIAPAAADTLITLGDYIDRGPDSRGVLDQLIALGRRYRLIPLLGNHEEMLIAALSNRQVLECWLACGGLETLGSYGYSPGRPAPRGGLAGLVPEPHWAFLAGCRPHHETPSHIFTHAGYDPALPMDRQPAEALRWQFTDRRSARPHVSGKTAIVGHTPQRSGRVLDLGFLVCIDTHCHGGKWLTALDVGSGKVWQGNQRGTVRQEQLEPRGDNTAKARTAS